MLTASPCRMLLPTTLALFALFKVPTLFSFGLGSSEVAAGFALGSLWDTDLVMVGGLEELDRSTFARFEEEATVFLAKLGTADGVLGTLTVATLVSSVGVWGFALERQVLISSVFDLTLLLMGLEIGFLRETLSLSKCALLEVTVPLCNLGSSTDMLCLYGLLGSVSVVPRTELRRDSRLSTALVSRRAGLASGFFMLLGALFDREIGTTFLILSFSEAFKVLTGLEGAAWLGRVPLDFEELGDLSFTEFLFGPVWSLFFTVFSLGRLCLLLASSLSFAEV